LAALAFALVELPLSLLATRGVLRPLTVVNFVALDLSLAAVATLLIAPLFALVYLAARRFLPAPGAPRGPSRLVPWLWAAGLVSAGYLAISVALTLTFLRRFKEKLLIATSLAVAQLVLILVGLVVVWLLHRLLATAGRGLDERLGAANPLTRPAPAIALAATILTLPVRELFRRVHSLGDLVPWRELLAIGVVLGAGFAAARLLEKRGTPGKRARLAAIPVLLLVVVTFWKLGADPEAKYVVLTGSPPLARLMTLVRWANDFDRDGYGSLLGDNDCGPFDAKVNPSARDIADNGVDENCNGRDFAGRGQASWRSTERLPVPDAFKKDWNILLVTVDTVRYDHTGFGGYKERRGRDTTPHLDAFVARSTSFTFAQAPSAGTMASVPAIVISRFFHSGIALGPERPKQPPLVLPENVTLAEILKEAGYVTGAFTTHEYFENWGLDQGFDTFDNSLGMPPDPFRSPAPQLTDKAIGWMQARQGKKWFLWTHYIDPHGRYVAHPGGRSFGTTEEDLYDGELAFTDEHLGRLLDWVAKSPDAARTIVVITSDHGDGFNEHGHINHGMSLYWELLHVPLIFHVPGLAPRQIGGAVSNIDILPTLADLAGADVGDLEVEGESLVPQLFHGRDASARVVFAETNWPDPLRAVITGEHKLVYNFKANHYQLFALATDPGEKVNLWGRDRTNGERLKALLDEWLDRVYYSRDPGSQAEQRRREKFLVTGQPTPRRSLEARFASAIRVVGVDTGTPTAGKDLEITVYFQALEDGKTSYRAELSVLGADGQVALVRQEKPFAEGVFPTSKWQRGDYVKETFKLRLPAEWKPQTPLRLSLIGPERKPASAEGPNAVTPTQVELGVL
jgi:arylsulfatase A-like enzyme